MEYLNTHRIMEKQRRPQRSTSSKIPLVAALLPLLVVSSFSIAVVAAFSAPAATTVTTGNNVQSSFVTTNMIDRIIRRSIRSTISYNSDRRIISSTTTSSMKYTQTPYFIGTSLYARSSDDDDDDKLLFDDDDDDEYSDTDIAAFRNQMSSMFGSDGDEEEESKMNDDNSDTSFSSVDDLIRFASKSAAEAKPNPDWAKLLPDVQVGCVLVANPDAFCTEFMDDGNDAAPSKAIKPNASLLSKFALSCPPPLDLGPDRRADLLPVLIVTHTTDGGTRAVLLNRRTGYLLGDLDHSGVDSGDGDDTSTAMSVLEKFCIQPLWFGGTLEPEANSNNGLEMLHQCPEIDGAVQVTEDGLYWGGNTSQATQILDAQDDTDDEDDENDEDDDDDDDENLLSDGDDEEKKLLSGFDFKFFVQTTQLDNDTVQQFIRDDVFFPIQVSKAVLFKPRDRMGTQRLQPLWTEIMELAASNACPLRAAVDTLYGGGQDDASNDPESSTTFE